MDEILTSIEEQRYILAQNVAMTGLSGNSLQESKQKKGVNQGEVNQS